MSLKIKEEFLHVESLIGENTTQTVLQTTLDIPSTAPNIARVVWVKGSAVITDSIVGLDKVNLEGCIDLSLVYMYEDLEENRLNYQVVPYRHAINFSDYVEVIGAEEDMLVQAKVDLLEIEWELQLHQRTVHVDVLMQSTVKVKQQSSYQAVTNASVRAPKKLVVDDGVFHVQSQLKQVSTSQLLDEDITLPEGAVPINLILESHFQPKELKTQVTAENISISGKLASSLIYLDENGNVEYCTMEESAAFQLTVPNETKITELVVEPQIKVNAKPEFTPPSLSYNLYGELDLKLTLYELKYVRLVMDLDCSGCLIETRTRGIMLDNLINQKTQQSSARGVIELGSNNPPIREILQAEGWIKSFDYRIDEDKVFVDGAISLEIVYLAHTDEELKPLYMAEFNNAIPFQQSIAIGGVQPGMTADLTITVDELQLDLINRETIEIDVSYCSKLKVTEPIHQEVVVEALEIPPLTEDPPSVTYVFVKNKDTLWKLSRQYHTSVEAIIDSNSWLRERDDMTIRAGDRLCIPRKG